MSGSLRPSRDGARRPGAGPARRAEARSPLGALVLVLLAACVATAGCAPASTPPAAVPVGRSAPEPADASSGPTPSPTAPLVPIRVSFSAYAMANVPLAIAQEAGYFHEEGLDASLLAIIASAQNAAALITGEVDLSALGGIGPMRARANGTDLVMIGATKPYFAGAIVGRPDIATPADLRGKRLGISAKGGNTDLMARTLLPRFGLEPDRDVALLSSGGNPETVAALVAGAIDAASVTPPADERARNLGFPTVVDVTALRLPYPAVALGTSGTTLANRADVLERALRAYGRGVYRYRTDRPYTLAVALDFLRNDDVAANEQAYEVERGVMQPDLDLPLAAVQSALDLMKADEPRAAEMRPEEFVDLRLVQGLQRAGFFDGLAAPR